jgi:hypothetical protein
MEAEKVAPSSASCQLVASGPERLLHYYIYVEKEEMGNNRKPISILMLLTREATAFHSLNSVS